MAALSRRYRLVEEIGRGGMSVVWRGHDEVLDRPVAVKFLYADYANDEAFQDRMRREARAAARLSHPHVAVVHDFGQTPEGQPYLVMELIDGPSLADRLRDGHLPAGEAFAVCADVAAALVETHRRGLVHRDVKPANVMLTDSGAKLVDFGISDVLEDASNPDPGGPLVGTPPYVAPELLGGHPAGPPADVYALGVLLHQALTGQLPWSVETPTQMLRAHTHATPRRLPPIQGVPAELIRLSEHCLAKDPATRPTCAELAAAWSSAAAHAHGTDRGATRAARPSPTVPVFYRHPVATVRRAVRRRPRTIALIATAIVGLALVTGPSVTADDPRVLAAGLTPAESVLGGPACKVVYQLDSDDGHRFSGVLWVQNTGREPLGATALTFAYPENQQVTGRSFAQHGSTVTVATTQLPPGAASRLPFDGRYDGVNAMPGGFALGSQPCTAQTVGITGQPVQPAGAGQGPKGDKPAGGRKATPTPKEKKHDHDK